MDYQEFYHLKFEPFANHPDPKFYFNSPQHALAKEYLFHAARGTRGLAVLLGDIGTGKTMLVRKLLSELHSMGRFHCGLIILTHSEFPSGWLFAKIANLLGLTDLGTTTTEIISRISSRLNEIYRRNEKTVIIIDEANKIKSPEILEEIRGLLNLEIADTRLISFILSGLPELESFLALNRALYQRIAVKVKLKPLGSNTIKAYISHRLSIAGAQTQIFTPGAMEYICRYSDGRPRLVNIICDNALLEGYVQRKQSIDESIVERVVGNLGLKFE
ncbi:MAG: AAA family ATPase [candidate division WOR-3 bacterium]